MNRNKKSEAMALWAVQIPKPEKRSQGSREQPTHDGAQPHKRVAALHARVRSLQSENKHKIKRKLGNVMGARLLTFAASWNTSYAIYEKQNKTNEENEKKPAL